MIKIRSEKSGVTLVEMAIGVAVTSILIIALMNFFGSGLKSSQKGMDHLNNMGAASILMSQIEYDLMRATKILSPGSGETSTSAAWEFIADSSGAKGIISYELADNGIEREEKTTTETHHYLYCKDRKVNLSFDNLLLTDASLKPDRTGILVALFVSSPIKNPEKQSEEFKLLRLISCRNIKK